jgi:hypothetical protein
MIKKDLDEIQSSQGRPVTRALEEYQESFKDRNMAIVEAY